MRVIVEPPSAACPIAADQLANETANSEKWLTHRKAQARATLAATGISHGYTMDQVPRALGTPASTRTLGNRTMWTYNRGTVIIRRNGCG